MTILIVALSPFIVIEVVYESVEVKLNLSEYDVGSVDLGSE